MKYDRGDGLSEDRGGFLGLLDSFARVGRDPWCSRGPYRAPFAAIIRWADTFTGTIGGPSWTGVGLHELHARPVRTELMFCEGYRPGVRGKLHVYGGPSLTSS